jgi:hypothetical protein
VGSLKERKRRKKKCERQGLRLRTSFEDENEEQGSGQLFHSSLI